MPANVSTSATSPRVSVRSSVVEPAEPAERRADRGADEHVRGRSPRRRPRPGSCRTSGRRTRHPTRCPSLPADLRFVAVVVRRDHRREDRAGSAERDAHRHRACRFVVAEERADRRADQRAVEAAMHRRRRRRCGVLVVGRRGLIDLRRIFERPRIGRWRRRRLARTASTMPSAAFACLMTSFARSAAGPVGDLTSASTASCFASANTFASSSSCARSTSDCATCSASTGSGGAGVGSVGAGAGIGPGAGAGAGAVRSTLARGRRGRVRIQRLRGCRRSAEHDGKQRAARKPDILLGYQTPRPPSTFRRCRTSLRLVTISWARVALRHRCRPEAAVLWAAARPSSACDRST